MLDSPAGDPLDDISALNQLFVDFLRSAPREERQWVGLPDDVALLLQAGGSACIGALTAFPRALFELRLPAEQMPAVRDPVLATPSHQALLQLSILNGAVNLSRRKPFAARLFLGLDERDVRRLRILTPAELLGLAAAKGVLTCAFSASAWLWRSLLTETRPEARRQLLLIAMQPRLPTHAPAAPAAGQQITA